jgi:hypothetical protein
MVSLSAAKSLVSPTNEHQQPPYATAYNTREQPVVRVHKPPLLRYVEECPAIVVSDADEKYCLVGYGEISISEYYDVVETGEDKQKLRVPRLRHLRPRARYQTTKDVSDPVSTSDSDEPERAATYESTFDSLSLSISGRRSRRRRLIPQTAQR